MKDQPPKVKPPSKLETIATAMEKDHAHQHSLRLISRRAVLQFALQHLDEELLQLNAAIAKTKDKKAEMEAKILGLSRILDKR